MINKLKNRRYSLGVGVLIVVILLISYFFNFWSTKSEYFALSTEDDLSKIQWDLPIITPSKERTENILISIRKIESNKNNISKYEYHLSLATNYRLLKEGKKSYEEYLELLNIAPQKSLIWGNIGNLLVEAGAIYSAQVAFEKASKFEPQFPQNHITLIDFYRIYFPEQKEKISKLFDQAYKHLGQNQDVMKTQASWYEEDSDYKTAIKIWKSILLVSENKIAINEKIKRLEAMD